MREFTTASARGLTSIKSRILLILGILALGYLLLLAMVQTTARTTHLHMERISRSLFPASSKLNDAEGAFARVRKEYKDAVTLEDHDALSDAGKAADDVRAALTALHAQLASSPVYARRVEALQERFADISSRSLETYGAILASKGSICDDLQLRAGALANEHRRFDEDMQALDVALTNETRGEFTAVDAASSRARIIGWIVLLIALLGCAGAWRVLQSKAFVPLERLARRMRDIAQAESKLTGTMNWTKSASGSTYSLSAWNRSSSA